MRPMRPAYSKAARKDTDMEAALQQAREAVKYGGVRRVVLVLEVLEGCVVDYRVQRITKKDEDWGGIMRGPSRRAL